MGTYLVTGGAGFIGSHLVESLLLQGHQVRVIDDLSTGKNTNLPSEVAFFQGDIGDEDLIKKAIADIDGCFHLAAIASVQRSVEDWQETHRVNLAATIAILDMLGKHNPVPFIYASSAAIYGDNPNLPLKETEAPAPINAYGADKYGCELHAAVASKLFAIPSYGFRFFNIYGPRQDPSSPYSGVISIFADRIQKKQPITIFGDGKQARDFVYVGDVVRILSLAMKKAHEGKTDHGSVHNICRGAAVTLLELAAHLMAITGNEVAITYEAAKAGDIYRSIGDNSLLKSAFDYSPATTIEEGLRYLCNAQLQRSEA